MCVCVCVYVRVCECVCVYVHVFVCEVVGGGGAKRVRDKFCVRKNKEEFPRVREW